MFSDLPKSVISKCILGPHLSLTEICKLILVNKIFCGIVCDILKESKFNATNFYRENFVDSGNGYRKSLKIYQISNILLQNKNLSEIKDLNVIHYEVHILGLKTNSFGLVKAKINTKTTYIWFENKFNFGPPANAIVVELPKVTIHDDHKKQRCDKHSQMFGKKMHIGSLQTTKHSNWYQAVPTKAKKFFLNKLVFDTKRKIFAENKIIS